MSGRFLAAMPGHLAHDDFLVFTVQALASLRSGWLLYHWQWDGIVYACMPLVLVFAILLWMLRKEISLELLQ